VARLTDRGWELLTLSSDSLAVTLVPGKGADITSVRWLDRGIELLWQSPWGLRHRGAPSVAGGSHTRFMDNWPGGWQTIFPNAGPARVVGGVEQPFHGEAALAPWEVVDLDEHEATVTLETRLTRSPFRMRRRVAVVGNGLVVEETALNEGAVRYDAMWSHHPSFGPPLVGPDCRLSTSARVFAADPGVPPVGDYTRVPGPDAGVAWMAYLSDFAGAPEVVLDNGSADVAVTLSWDADPHPCAWLWLEAGATREYPFWGSGYVLAVEPAWAGLHDGVLLGFEPGQWRTATTRLSVGPSRR
jgi:hypothetical protein